MRRFRCSLKPLGWPAVAGPFSADASPVPIVWPRVALTSWWSLALSASLFSSPCLSDLEC